MAFIKDYLALFIKEDNDLDDADKTKVVGNLAGSYNKLAIMSKSKILLLGDFTKHDETGCYFSNMNWNYVSYGFGNNSRYYGRYDCFNDDYYDYYGNDYYCGCYKDTKNRTEEKKKETETQEQASTPTPDLQDECEYDFEDIYDSMYDTVSKLYLFDEVDCPFSYEGRVDYCNCRICANANKCKYYKQNRKALKREKRKARQMGEDMSFYDKCY